MASKYPYIKDKNLYAAVMYAAKKIRETGWRNKAIYWASSKFGVSEESIDEELRKRQSIGQKGKSRKYKWFIVDEYTNYQYRDEYAPHVPDVSEFQVVRAVDKRHAEFCSPHFGYGRDNECYCQRIRECVEEFNTKKEAEDALRKMREEKGYKGATENTEKGYEVEK